MRKLLLLSLLVPALASADEFILKTGLKNLSDNSAEAFLSLAVPQNAPMGGKVFYFIKCKSAANQAEQFGQVTYACHNVAGTVSCGFGTPDGVTLGDGTASVDTPTFTASAGTNAVDFNIQSDCTGITPTSIIMRWWVGGEPAAISAR